MIGSVILFQGVQAVALPLVQEFGYTKEIEDRVLAPLPVELVAIGKVVSGALQCLLAALIVFPIARFVPATPVDLAVNWPVLLTFLPAGVRGVGRRWASRSAPSSSPARCPCSSAS